MSNFCTNTYLEQTRDYSDPDITCNFIHCVAPPITCKNGYLVTVNASFVHECSPKSNIGPWETVEVVITNNEGFSRFGFVPVSDVNKLVDLYNK